MLMATGILSLLASCDAKKALVSPMARVADYQWMTAKMDGELIVANGEYPFTGTIRIHRDSTVWLSVSAFMGMESIRALATPDSVVMINRLNQTYLAEPLSVVSEKTKLPSLQGIQDLLLGNGTKDHVAIKWGPYLAKIRYSEIQWDEPTTFPIKISKNYERMKL